MFYVACVFVCYCCNISCYWYVVVWDIGYASGGVGR